MKYIQERNGKKEVIEKRKRSRNYYIRGIVRWGISIGILCLVLLVCVFADKKLNEGKIMDSIKNTVGDISGDIQTGTEISPKETEGASKEDHVLTVCIDPGHGGFDRGGDSDGREEAADTWALAQAVKKEMEAAGIKVIMTREDDDTKVKLEERVTIANNSDADYFISLHRNKGDGYGAETWISLNPSEEAKTLGEKVHQGLVTAGVQRDRGMKQGSQGSPNENYYVIANTNMEACLVELGFVNNSEDNSLYDANTKAYAKAITEAVNATYEQYGQTKSEGNAVEGESATEQGAVPEVSSKKGMLLANPEIGDIPSLSAETLDWGQGSNVDEQNRPTGSLSYQEKYKERSADFVIPTLEKKIYLTLDEGYEYGCTPSILQTLKEKNVKATFFVTKPYAEKDPDLVRQMIDDGHILGNHSVTHPAKGLPSQSLEEQKQEVLGNHQYIKENFDYDMFLFRFPAGKFSEQSLAVLNNCGYRSVFWSFAYLDYDVNNQPNEAESLQKLIDRLHPGAIYLLHAESWTNTNILGEFIDKAREAGYEFADYTEVVSQGSN